VHENGIFALQHSHFSDTSTVKQNDALAGSTCFPKVNIREKLPSYRLHIEVTGLQANKQCEVQLSQLVEQPPTHGLFWAVSSIHVFPYLLSSPLHEIESQVT
jgi:hypothetical protein